MTSTDPTRHSLWRPLWDVMNRMDADIARLDEERGVAGVRPRFTIVLIRLAHEGPMTIGQLAASIERTHSAMSQTVAALRRNGLVDSVPGADARTREIALTERGLELVPFLEAEWRATEAAAAELEDEIPYPLNQVVADLGQALDARSFRDRLVSHLNAGGTDEAADASDEAAPEADTPGSGAARSVS